MKQPFSKTPMRSHHERLLVISDNPELCQCLIDTVNGITFEHPFRVDFRYTYNNKTPEDMIALGAEEINVKDDDTIDFITRTYDLVFSVHCKQIFPKCLVESVCCINFHPGLNPFNRGWYPQAFSIINGLHIGATIHVMDERIDHGDIIDQRETYTLPADTSYDVYRRVIATEKELIKKNLYPIIENVFERKSPVFEGNYNGVADFHRLCALDLDEVGSLRDHLNLLRATTHGQFKNAYFHGADGVKYYVRVTIETESDSE